MKSSKTSKTKKNKSKGNAAEPLQQFFIWHGEKFVVGIVVVAALWLALQGLGYQTLSWQPSELEEIARSTEDAIKQSTRTAADEEIKVFDYATHADQIKKPIPLAPYRAEVVWFPALYPSPQARGNVKVLAVESLKGEPHRTGVTRGGSTGGQTPDKWTRPPLQDTDRQMGMGGRPGRRNSIDTDFQSIWVNLFGVIPALKQWDIYDQTFSNSVKVDASLGSPEYSYYELERAEYLPGRKPNWQPVIVYPAKEFGGVPKTSSDTVTADTTFERLIPFGQISGQLGLNDTSRRSSSGLRGSGSQQGSTSGRGSMGGSNRGPDTLLLYSDGNIEPAKTYAYRIRLYLVNPNYNLPEGTVDEGVDTKSEYIMSDWSTLALVYVPDQTAVRLLSVIPPDRADFPRQTSFQSSPKGTMLLDYFDLEMAQALPPVEKTELVRGSICNMSKEDAVKSISKTRTSPGGIGMGIDFPDTGLRSNVCVADLSGGRKLQKGTSKEAVSSPDLVITSKALLLHPNGMMQVASTLPEPKMGNAGRIGSSGYSSPSGSGYSSPPSGSDNYDGDY